MFHLLLIGNPFKLIDNTLDKDAKELSVRKVFGYHFSVRSGS